MNNLVNVEFTDLNPVDKKKKFKSNLKKQYLWGIGLEHELHIFHVPLKGIIKDFAIFNIKDSILRIIEMDKKKKIKLTPYQRELIDNPMIDEPSGRLHAGQWVLKKIELDMIEFISKKPFARMPIEDYVQFMINIEKEFMNLVYLHNKYSKQKIIKNGELSCFPFGTNNFIKVPINSESISPIYYYKKTSKNIPTVKTDYTGSYHISVTLPFTDKTSETKFINNHINYSNQIQWIEPLLLTAYFGADLRCIGRDKSIKGSFRVARVGWGNFAGSDVRKFAEGIGRYSIIHPYWRDNFKFHNSNKTDILKKITGRVKRDTPQAVSGFSSNFRTFGSENKDHPGHRYSGLGMTKPNGIEIRIFDNFDVINLNSLCKLLMYLAENSRKTKTNKYVYKDKDWIYSIQQIMLHGWKAILKKTYINKLESNLGLKLYPKSNRAYDILIALNESLYKKNKIGKWSKMLIKKRNLPKIPTINRDSINMAILIKMNRDPKFKSDFMKFIYDLNATNFNDFNKQAIKIMKTKYKNDIEDFMWFLEKLEIIQIKNNKIIKNSKNIKKLNNIDNIIRQHFNFFNKYVNNSNFI